jgi:hypothetical protein
MFAFGIVAAVLCMNTRPSHAYQTGESKWCTVTNKGGDTAQWQCEYDTSDDCAAAVAGTPGGFAGLLIRNCFPAAGHLMKEGGHYQVHRALATITARLKLIAAIKLVSVKLPETLAAVWTINRKCQNV